MSLNLRILYSGRTKVFVEWASRLFESKYIKTEERSPSQLHALSQLELRQHEREKMRAVALKWVQEPSSLRSEFLACANH